MHVNNKGGYLKKHTTIYERSRLSSSFTTVSQRAFTIVELLIVIVVIGILATLTIVSYNGIQSRARTSSLVSELSQVAKALEIYKQTNGQYPSSIETAVPNVSDKLTYHFNSRSNSYCVDGRDGDVQYSVYENQLTPSEIDCTEQGLALWLPFNGNTSDTSGNGYSLTSTGAPALTTGASGTPNSAYAFDGIDDFMYIDNDSIPVQLNHFTVSLWMKGTGAGGSDYACGVHRSFDSAIGSSIFWLGANTGQNISVSANGKFSSGATGINTNNSTWRNVVLVYAGGYQTGYVDGQQYVDVSIGPITNNASGNRLSVGSCDHANYRDITGAIDDIRIYNRALTGEEVENLFISGAE